MYVCLHVKLSLQSANPREFTHLERLGRCGGRWGGLGGEIHRGLRSGGAPELYISKALGA